MRTSVVVFKAADVMLLRAIAVRSMALVGCVPLLPTFMPAIVPAKPPSRPPEMVPVRFRAPAGPWKEIVSPAATGPSSSAVELLASATMRPVTPAPTAPMMSRSPPDASYTPAPETAPVNVPKPLIAPSLSMAPASSSPPAMVIVSAADTVTESVAPPPLPRTSSVFAPIASVAPPDPLVSIVSESSGGVLTSRVTEYAATAVPPRMTSSPAAGTAPSDQLLPTLQLPLVGSFVLPLPTQLFAAKTPAYRAMPTAVSGGSAEAGRERAVSAHVPSSAAAPTSPSAAAIAAPVAPAMRVTNSFPTLPAPARQLPRQRFAAGQQRTADCTKIFTIGSKVRGRPFTGGEGHPTGRAMREDVDCGDIAPLRYCHRDLARRRHIVTEQNSLDPWPKLAQQHRQVRRAGVDKCQFSSLDAGIVNNLAISR